jgi:hypothetical protein
MPFVVRVAAGKPGEEFRRIGARKAAVAVAGSGPETRDGQ